MARSPATCSLSYDDWAPGEPGTPAALTAGIPLMSKPCSLTDGSPLPRETPIPTEAPCRGSREALGTPTPGAAQAAGSWFPPGLRASSTARASDLTTANSEKAAGGAQGPMDPRRGPTPAGRHRTTPSGVHPRAAGKQGITRVADNCTSPRGPQAAGEPPHLATLLQRASTHFRLVRALAPRGRRASKRGRRHHREEQAGA